MTDSQGGACHGPGCCGNLDRRNFLKVTGAGLASACALGDPLLAGGEPPATLPAGVRHFVPADKKLSRQWIDGLFARGEPRVCRGKELDSIGMPVGGIAAGQLYLRGDGTLGCWQIFNRDYGSGYGATCYDERKPGNTVDQRFVVVVDAGGKRSVKRLNRQDFPDVEFIGEYPIGRIRYKAAGFPLAIEMEAFSPFIPLNAADSGLPATIFNITVANTSDHPLYAEVVGWLENAVCYHNAADLHAERVSAIVERTDRTLVVHSAREAPADKPEIRMPIVLADFEGGTYGEWTTTGEAFGDKPAAGTLPDQNPVSGFVGQGLVNTYLGGDRPQGTLTSPLFTITRRYVNFLIGGGDHPGETCINLLVDGKVVRTATGRNDEKLAWSTWNVEPLGGREARIEIVDKHSGGWGHVNVDQIELADERRGGPTGPLNKLHDFGTMVLALGESDARGAVSRDNDPAQPGDKTASDLAWPVGKRGYGRVMSPPVPLKPGERRSFRFVLAWHFPNFGDTGQQYAARFPDAAAVANYILDQHERLTRDTRLWHDTYYDSTLPHWLLDRIGSTNGNLATGTTRWWANGRFWAWEGVGCCHGTCTHVWNYAHGMARLFPELERNLRQGQDLGVALHPNGLVGFRGELNKAYAADGQAGTVLKCYREHLMSPDGEFLKRTWPRIKTVLGFSIEQDGNDDGLIENSQHNTFDINFEGANTFVGSLYLGALRAAEEMAREVGDADFARRARAIFESGSKRSVERLFNGEYFIQDVDLAKHPKDQYADGCLSDQMFGQGWAHQLGLGYLYPPQRVRSALEAVWRYNWAPDVGPHNAAHPPERWFARPGEAGLFTCTWPKSRHLDEGVRYRDEVWTGIEYQVAGHMVHEGMLTEALAIVRGVHERYDPAKRNPFNEVECGDHYARSLAAWGVFTALCGYEYHGPKGRLGFAPKLTPDDFRAAFTAAEGWGTFSQDRRSRRVEVRWGKVRLRELAFAIPEGANASTVTTTVGGEAVEATHKLEAKGWLTVSFREELALEPGRTLEVSLV